MLNSCLKCFSHTICKAFIYLRDISLEKCTYCRIRGTAVLDHWLRRLRYDKLQPLHLFGRLFWVLLPFFHLWLFPVPPILTLITQPLARPSRPRCGCGVGLCGFRGLWTQRREKTLRKARRGKKIGTLPGLFSKNKGFF